MNLSRPRGGGQPRRPAGAAGTQRVALVWLLLVVHLAFGAAVRAQAEGDETVRVDPIGIWKCVVYGDSPLVDERLLLRFLPGGQTDFARPTGGSNRPWAPLSRWAVSEEGALSFRDPRLGREYTADLVRSTLGGHWRMRSMAGGWWCVEVESIVTDTEVVEFDRSSAGDLMPPLLPEVMATPAYPLAAIRRGLEGHSVACFFVTAAGAIVAPAIVELTDEMFRLPTLAAVAESRYRRWAQGEEDLRPACRSYRFTLDSVSRAEWVN